MKVDESMKEELQRRIRAKREADAARPLATPPRYDEVFFEGIAWLDSLAESEPTTGGA